MIRFSFPLYRKDVLQAIDQVSSRWTLNELLREIWENPSSWRRRTSPRSLAQTSTLGEADWRHIVEYARLRFDSLPADARVPRFVDPRGLDRP